MRQNRTANPITITTSSPSNTRPVAEPRTAEGEVEDELLGGDVTVTVDEELVDAPFSVAVTVSTTLPDWEPALNAVAVPVLEFNVPSVLLNVQAYVTPVGHVPPLHTADAVRSTVPPVEIDGEVALRMTELRLGAEGAVIVIETPVLCSVTAFNVALTNNVTDPAVDPAVKRTDAPVVEDTVPSSLVRVHRYAVPEGQEDAPHDGVAVKPAWLPANSVTEEGFTETEVSTGTGETVRTVVALALTPCVSLTKTFTVELPVAVGVQESEVAFAVVHPLGSPVYA